MNDEELRALVGELAAGGALLATAESLTGGALSARIVDVPGASRVFLGGVTTYATPLKAAILGVDPEVLDSAGPVDPRVAIAMAEGVRALMGADFGLATTGVAGPGPQDGHPAGTVYIAIAAPTMSTHRLLALSGTRAQIRARTVDRALELLAEALRSGDGAKAD
ncbi:CinA family protein [Schaalia hyovaginalis]|uniref:CinA family protein n=2 Tax=Schaalia hyovaginalis TaxID=29316 RepID=UPI0023F78CF8|nr:CinA family protein [Schaalia hyovaginalis]MCI7671194.1 CinA family protein [Schaalia hyovaginalis]